MAAPMKIAHSGLLVVNCCMRQQGKMTSATTRLYALRQLSTKSAFQATGKTMSRAVAITLGTGSAAFVGSFIPSVVADSGVEAKQNQEDIADVSLVPSTDYLGYAYAGLVAMGGIMGYVKARSVPSLAAGLAFGGISAFGAYQLSNDPNNFWLLLGTSSALTAVMGSRAYRSKKFMPAGLVATLSILTVMRLAPKLM